ncbi:hypothetical protein JZ751_008848 [Albula glossodonta]|uniref:E3 ubiquitin-protein ligase Hakai n=1 Tax=Albula glossodonta TaxID=121402 RepID=A0A8T2NZU8_9TELE|nr:hypothetical protein JZ751_008848 [Albula glossodonta]
MERLVLVSLFSHFLRKPRPQDCKFRFHRALLRIMDQSDNDLQGTDGSGSLGGPDVRRRIPIKLLSKQAIRSKPVVRPQRAMNRLPSKSTGDEEGFGYKQEERFECKSGDAFGSQRRFPQQMFWDYKLNLIGEKDDTPVHFCDKCGLPIKIYGRMIPCKHVFCYECAVLYEKKCDKMCPGCTDPVQRIEQCLRGSLFMCSMVQGCKRTYLSQRDLQAHINHRHMRAGKPAAGRPGPGGGDALHLPPASSDLPERFLLPPDKHRLPPPPHLPKPHVLLPPPLQHTAHDPYGQPPHDDLRPAQPPPSSSSDLGPSRSIAQETFRIATVTTRKHSNLITVPIQDDSSSSATSREPLPQPGPGPGPAPPHHHPGDYPGQPVVSHPHHMMAPQQHYGPPPPPPPPSATPCNTRPRAQGRPTWCTTRPRLLCHPPHPLSLHPLDTSSTKCPLT